MSDISISAIGVPFLYAVIVRISRVDQLSWHKTIIDSPTFYIGAASKEEARKKVEDMYLPLTEVGDVTSINIGLVE